ncbi:EML1_2 [Acanthosepion pharaonis]|uniref:EML1_2 n=1 Tax=Acanthosepion pharaonis TaxID=158019 RepID=A0A812BC65_ACAPH|nr:EML1_2 [Sepia pharaonis]
MEKTSQMERTEPKKLNRKGRLVTFYRNGDPFSSGLIVSISQKSFPTLDSLLAWLNTKIVTTNGVKFIFSYPDGHEVKSVSDFRGGYLYVVSSTRTFNRNIKYGVCKEQQQMWSNKALTGENMKNGAANPNVVKGRSRHGSLGGQTQWRPRVITVISNTNRELRERLILNPKTTQNFEELPLWKGRPVKALYTIQPPYIKVESYSQLFRDFKDHHTFLACGEELPLELNNQALSESDSSGIDSVNGFHDIRIPKRAQIHGAALPSVPPINEDLSKNRNGVPKPFSDRPFAPRTGAVRVEILGQTREFYPPTVFDAIDDGSKPDKLLTLQWVYGYRGHDTRYNLLILPSTGELVYYVGTVVVIFDRVNGIQRHYMGHTEDITCLAMHPNQKWLATGQQAGNSTQQQFQAAHIRIWDSRMLNTYAIIGLGTMKVSVCSLGFSIQSNGDFLQAVDEHDLHVLRVWDWQNEKLIAQTTTTPYSHLYFWKLAWDPYRERQGRLLRDTRSGHFDDESTRILTCVCFSALGDVIVGDSTGSISVWTREDDDDDEDLFILNKYFSDNIRPKHKNAIFGMVTLQDGTLLTAAGRELKVWDTMDSFKLIKERVLPESIGNIRALVIQNPSSTDGVIYLGTTKGYIWEGFLQHKFTPVVQGHNQSVSAVTVIQGESAFVTVGVDHLVIKWSMENHNVTWKIMLEGPCTCVNIDPQGDMLIVGTSIGRLHIINTYDGLPITSLQISTEPISSLQFSPNESYLAAGSQDGKITVFKVLYDGQFYRKLGILDTFNIAVSHIDWSMDSRYIQSESTDHELQYWNVMELTKVKSARVMRDVDWASHTCTLAFTHLGAWSNLDSNEILTTVGCFTGKTTNYLCAGDNKGRLRLYKYPCSCYKAKFNEEKQCSSSLINIQTLDSNGGLLSSGTDASLMQWAIESDDDNI